MARERTADQVARQRADFGHPELVEDELLQARDVRRDRGDGGRPELGDPRPAYVDDEPEVREVRVEEALDEPMRRAGRRGRCDGDCAEVVERVRLLRNKARRKGCQARLAFGTCGMEDDESMTYEAQSQVLRTTLEVELSEIVSQEEDPQVHGARRNAMDGHGVGRVPIVG